MALDKTRLYTKFIQNHIRTLQEMESVISEESLEKNSLI